jgi:hypothetical protein
MPTLHSKQSGPMQKAETFDKFSIFKMAEDRLFVDKYLGTTLSCGMVVIPQYPKICHRALSNNPA